MIRFMQAVTEGGTGGVADAAEAEGRPAAEERGRGGAGAGPEYDCFQGQIVVIDIATDVEIKKGVQSFPHQAWFESLVQSCGTVGFDMEWKPDRYAGSNNRVALMQFADAETAVLVRTHRTDAWLPDVLIELLTSKRVTKICVGYDGSDKRKLMSTFNFELDGVVDLAELAPSKGKKNTGLKKLAADFGWQMRKESRVARSDWTAASLTEDQIQYAAEDAYFTFMIFEELADLPDAPVDSDDDADVVQACQELASVLTLKPGWAEQGIIKNNNGLWCSVCNKGPMLHVDVMEKHILSKLHVKKTQPEKAAAEKAAAAPAELAVAADVPLDLAEQGIVRGGEGGYRGTQAEYLCALCDAGPFQCLKAAEAHVNGRKHESLQRKRETEAAIETGKLPPELEAAGGEVADGGTFRCRFCETAGPFQDLLSLRQHLNGKWHIKFAGLPAKPDGPDDERTLPESDDEPVDLTEGLPAYVEERSEGAFFCVLCGCKATGLGTMQRHLVSEGHSRSCQRTGHPELVYIKERDQLEELRTGRAVKRSETYERQKAPGASAGGRPDVGGGGDCGRGRGESRPDGWVAIPVGRSLSLGKEGLPRIDEDEDAPGGSAPPLASSGAAAADAVEDAPGSSALPSASSGGAPPAPPSASGGGGGDEPAEAVMPGSFVRAAATVVPPAPGWVWDLSTCLAVTAGEALQVVAVEDDWAYCRASVCVGWLPLAVLRASRPAPAAAPTAPSHAPARGRPREDLRSDVEDFIQRSALDARAADALRCEAPAVQRAIMQRDERDPVTTGENPSAIVMSWIRQACREELPPEGCGYPRGRPREAPRGAWLERDAAQRRADVDLRSDVEDFIRRSALDARAADALRSEAPAVQRMLVLWDQQDPVTSGGAQNPSAILMSRIKQARDAPRGAWPESSAVQRCADFEHGRCWRGASCRFAHREERRPRAGDQAPGPPRPLDPRLAAALAARGGGAPAGEATAAPAAAPAAAPPPAAPAAAGAEEGEPRRGLALVPGQVLRARDGLSEPPPEWIWAADDYLLPPAGHRVEVLAVEDGWVYGECCGRHGWLHPDALCGGEDAPGDAGQLGPPAVRRDGEGQARLSRAEFAELVRSTA